MRWHIIRILWQKEALRHLAQPGGILLAVLLVAAAVLLSFFGRSEAQTGALVGDVQHCFVDYYEDGPWIEHLKRNVPDDLHSQIVFRQAAEIPVVDGQIVYQAGCGAIQVRSQGRDESGQPHYLIWVWQPSSTGIAPFEAWFWRETDRFCQGQAATALAHLDANTRRTVLLPQLTAEHSQLSGSLDTRSALATALVLFALFFVCVYLLPSLTCEERERGVLLAQALSPASPLEILIAKMLFYPVVGIGLAAVLAGIANPAVLTQRFFWLALVVAAVGSLGIGLTIACLARSQRAASMGAMSYTLAVGLVLFISKQNSIPVLPNLFLEYYAPRMLHAALSQAVHWYHWVNLGAAMVLALLWNGVAVLLFRRCGWQ
jgi:hypothetical protein